MAVGGSGEAVGSVGVDDGGGGGKEPLSFVCWLPTTTNRASGFADAHFGCS